MTRRMLCMDGLLSKECCHTVQVKRGRRRLGMSLVRSLINPRALWVGHACSAAVTRTGLPIQRRMSFPTTALVPSRHGDFKSFPKRPNGPLDLLHPLFDPRECHRTWMGVGILYRPLPCPKSSARQPGDGCAAVSGGAWSATASTGGPRGLGA